MARPPRAADLIDDQAPADVVEEEVVFKRDDPELEVSDSASAAIDHEMLEFSGDLDELIRAQAEKMRAERRQREADEKKAREESAVSDAQAALRDFVKRQATALADELDRIEGTGSGAPTQSATVAPSSEASAPEAPVAPAVTVPEEMVTLAVEALSRPPGQRRFWNSYDDAADELHRKYPEASEAEVARAISRAASERLLWTVTLLSQDGLTKEAVEATERAFSEIPVVEAKAEAKQDERRRFSWRVFKAQYGDAIAAAAAWWVGSAVLLWIFFGVIQGTIDKEGQTDALANVAIVVIPIVLAIGEFLSRLSKTDDPAEGASAPSDPQRKG